MSAESAAVSSLDDSGLSVRIDRLAANTGVGLDSYQLHQLVLYLTALGRWNRTINLTSLDVETLPDTTLARLIGEPLSASAMLSAKDGLWYDLGSGGGSPALPLKVLRPHRSLRMVESKSRKVAFLREVARQMDLGGVEVLSSRFSDLITQVPPQSAQLVTIRAVRLDEALIQVLRHLLAPEGELVTFGADIGSMKAEGFLPIQTRGAIAVFSADVPRGTSLG